MRRIGLGMSLMLAAVFTWHAPALTTPQGSTINYQGDLQKNGAPVNGLCNLQFKLYDAPSGGSTVALTITVNNVNIVNGLFTVELTFIGSAAFIGDARWLEVAVQCPPDPGFTTLSPRQPVNATPYALRALGGANITLPFTGTTSITDGSGIAITNTGATNGHAFYGHALGTGAGSFAASALGTGALGAHEGTSGTEAGVTGISYSTDPNGAGVSGFSAAGRGVLGNTVSGNGVYGLSVSGPGVQGSSTSNDAMIGVHTGGGAVGNGVYGTTNNGNSSGVYGFSSEGWGVAGHSVARQGVWGDSQQNDGVLGSSAGTAKSGVAGTSSNANGWGGYFANSAGGPALRAVGKAQVNVMEILGSDLAESFPVREPDVLPGTVLAIDDAPDGRLRVSDQPYSRRVAGVVSGANGLDAAVVLKGASFENHGHATVALSGRVWVKADATREPIRVGDLLTTSDRPGQAMKASDTSRMTGAILGKAMTSLETGTGLVLVLVSLQ